MMNYLVFEGSSDQKFNATSKAREDVNSILLSTSFSKLEIQTSYKRYNNKLLKFLQIPYMINNYRIWEHEISKIKKSNIIIQYPVLNSVVKFNKLLKKISSNNNVILLIHDLDSLRGHKKNILRGEDKKNLKEVNRIICHNENMKNEIVKMGVDSSKIVTLDIFDYLYNNVKFKNRKKSNQIIIAGNLSSEKVKYLENIDKVNFLDFNLYGVGYNEKNKKNIHYKGKYSPEELLSNLDGSFGLIWDGDSILTCSGMMGNYLKYNNPHKLSMYISAGVPVICWSKAAISQFVIDNNLGIVVDNLQQISEKISALNEEEYQKMILNCKEISKKLKKGYYLKRSLIKIFDEEE